jgi:hypothetical protein
MPGLSTGRTAAKRRDSPELARPSAGSLKFSHFSATTSSGKKQRRIPAACCGS